MKIGYQSEPRAVAGSAFCLQNCLHCGDVSVAKIPGVGSAIDHRSVVPLSVLDQSCVLLGNEESIRIQLAIPASQFGNSFLHFDKLTDYLLLTGFAEANTGGISVGLCVLAEVFETCIAIASTPENVLQPPVRASGSLENPLLDQTVRAG
jgi:hypothetical protein